MSTAIELLMTEHRTIERALDALDSLATALRDGTLIPRARLAELVAFFREFADTKHHGKEEDLLFTAMITAGFPRDMGPIPIMLHEHDLGRGHVSRLAELAGGDGTWSDDERAAAAREAAAFSAMLRNHIAKEDNALYPMARERLSDAEMAELDRKVAEFEEAWTGMTGLPG